jgi:hypothetical protein
MNRILPILKVIRFKIAGLTIKRVEPALVLAVVFLAALPFSRAHRSASVDSARAASCAGPEYHSFDFWIGDWKAFDADNPATAVAHTRVDRILDGCVLLEDYEGTDGSRGESFTIYDASRQVWHQSWVTNHGVLLVVEGKLQAGKMILSGVSHPSGGKEKFVRGVWKPVNGGVRETAVTSTDGGKTWNPWFDLMFRPKASEASTNASAHDRSVIAGLDTQYQAAVKKNDATTIDHILADDFVLVTGSGRLMAKPICSTKAEWANCLRASGGQ